MTGKCYKDKQIVLFSPSGVPEPVCALGAGTQYSIIPSSTDNTVFAPSSGNFAKRCSPAVGPLYTSVMSMYQYLLIGYQPAP